MSIGMVRRLEITKLEIEKYNEMYSTKQDEEKAIKEELGLLCSELMALGVMKKALEDSIRKTKEAP